MIFDAHDELRILVHYTMGKVIYVNGNIVITTKFFVPKEIGCGYQTALEGAEVVEPTDVIDSLKCLLIDDEHPQSLFNEYYARDDVFSDSIATSYFIATYLDCIKEYCIRVSNTCDVIRKVEDWADREKRLVYKMAYVNILTVLDAFLCHVLLKRCVEDEQLFKAFMFKLAPSNKKDKWKRLQEVGKEGEWEQDAITFVLESSFINTEKLDELIKKIGLRRLKYDRAIMREHFRVRHLIVHRSGRQRDDNEVLVTFDSLKELINHSNALVGAVRNSLFSTLKEENKNKPEPPSIDEVFPDGVVKAPFKLSDLWRLLRGDTVQTDINPFDMPAL